MFVLSPVVAHSVLNGCSREEVEPNSGGEVKMAAWHHISRPRNNPLTDRVGESSSSGPGMGEERDRAGSDEVSHDLLSWEYLASMGVDTVSHAVQGGRWRWKGREEGREGVPRLAGTRQCQSAWCGIGHIYSPECKS